MKLLNMRRITIKMCNCCKFNIIIFTIDDSRLLEDHREYLHLYYWFWVGNNSS